MRRGAPAGHPRTVLVPAIILAISVGLTGCSSIGYYAQAVVGQFDVLARRQPIQDVLEDPQVSPALAARLRRIEQIRNFAVEELDLPDNGSYRSYADIEREYVVWSLVATPALSLSPQQSCFPVVGCVSYRGYYHLHDGAAASRNLRAKGFDVYLAPVPAYSTLGWFDDPVLSSTLRGPDWDVARLVFHELAHQRIYVRNDSGYNEAYASVVGREGQKRWLARFGTSAEKAAASEASSRREAFLALVRGARHALEALYASNVSDAQKRREKAKILRELRADYSDLRNDWNGYRGYDRWFAQDLNNAKFALVATYTAAVPGLQGVLASVGGDMARFHRLALRLGDVEASTRAAVLRACAKSMPACDAGLSDAL